MSAKERLDVRATGGGTIAVWVAGSGPGLVLVHGSMCDHTALDALIGELAGAFRCYAMDRRGFGASPDGAGYSAEREFGDVAAVVEAVAAREGGPVALFGHSWGASCAMGGAARTGNVRRLLLYEPSLGLAYPPGAIEAIEERVAAGDFDEALLFVLTDVAGMSREDVEALRASDLWAVRVATAPTIAREARIEAGWVLTPGQFQAISAPTLLISGSESPRELNEVVRRSAEAIPGARIATLQGHGHFAYRTHPREVAPVITGFAAG